MGSGKSAAGQINLPPGTWIVILHAHFETSVSSGYAEIWLDTTTGDPIQNWGAQGADCTSYPMPRLTMERIFCVTETTPVYGRYYQNSGSDRVVNYRIYAVRIK